MARNQRKETQNGSHNQECRLPSDAHCLLLKELNFRDCGSFAYFEDAHKSRATLLQAGIEDEPAFPLPITSPKRPKQIVSSPPQGKRYHNSAPDSL
ncbi:hypothetical protein AOE01nite_08570 [Acetobacter oeni]|uniref:Uncharacterized protein n=1 Tax=Acetobacter oeni TaxID=304077 RepID=A0A511XI61_9PROT|nr:hypothetical protein AOE01nite_08570 [Acetobacter oeni]